MPRSVATLGAILVFVAVAEWQGSAQRGPNPMTGLAGLVETPTTGPEAPRFEVTSVKRNQQGAGGDTNVRGLAGGAFRATNATLKMLIRSAYRLMLTDEIVGGPSWADSDGFDVDARPATESTLLQQSYMLRTLLADRFKLVVRKEPREGSIYALVLARRDGALGSQIKRSVGECTMIVPGIARPAGADAKGPDPAKFVWPAPGQPGRRCGIGPDGDTIKGGSIAMTTLITYLTPLLDHPVVDKTGLDG